MNVGYVDPPSLLAEPRPMALYPIQHAGPLVELTGPKFRAARRATTDFNKTELPAVEIAGPDADLSRCPAHVVTVHDTGEGLGDPFAGLSPAARNIGGRGRRITPPGVQPSRPASRRDRLPRPPHRGTTWVSPPAH
ncbi:hypothetical protein [Amycolatopsis sp. NPDC021455]|uniref:hypothetical protein n=1 Tax=Amycolatopsis sp. NPDC021455 TaxID=3154901 RepID=UPI0033DC36E7